MRTSADERTVWLMRPGAVLAAVAIGIAMLSLSIVVGGAPRTEAHAIPSLITVNGGASTVVPPGATVAVVVEATVPNNAGHFWSYTEWSIPGGPFGCVDHATHAQNTGGVESFVISAPAAAGTYDLTVNALAGSCGGGPASSFTGPSTLPAAIIVESPPTGPASPPPPQACVDSADPTNPAASSTSHTVGVPSDNHVISIAWPTVGAAGGASDDCNVDGFSWSFTASADDVPDTVREGEQGAVSASSGTLSDGSYWFHIRPRDAVGNWSDAAHVGPFIIDTTAPAIDVAGAAIAIDNERTSVSPVNVGDGVVFNITGTLESAPSATEVQVLVEFDGSKLGFVEARVGDVSLSQCSLLDAGRLFCDFGNLNADFEFQVHFTALDVTSSTATDATLGADFDGDGPVAMAVAGPASDDVEIVAVEGLQLPPTGDGSLAVGTSGGSRTVPMIGGLLAMALLGAGISARAIRRRRVEA